MPSLLVSSSHLEDKTGEVADVCKGTSLYLHFPS